MIDCLPLDDTCHIAQANYALQLDAAYAKVVNERSFSLGYLNGHKCTYTWIDGQPAILIEKDGEDIPEVLMGPDV